MVKLQHAKCPRATPIAGGRHQEVSLMRPQGTTPSVCAYCGRGFGAPTRKVKQGSGRFCSPKCYWATLRRSTVAQVRSDGSAEMPLYGRDGQIRAVTVVDAADAPTTSQWRWYLNNRGYAVRSEGTRLVLLHRAILGLTRGDGLEGDHINRDRLDNRRSNLRILTKQTNPQNQSSYRGSSSAFRGVSWDKSKQRWVAYIYMNGKRTTLGRFREETEAAATARDARRRLMPFAVEDEP